MQKKYLFTLVPVLGLAFFLGYWKPSAPVITHDLSVPPAAFSPNQDGCDWTNAGQTISNDSGSCTYLAPVYLDQGMTVTKVTLYFYDDSAVGADVVNLTLYRGNNTGTRNSMAYIESNGGGDSSKFDDTISHDTIDNTQYSYHLVLGLYSPNVKAYRVSIEYGYPNSALLPLVFGGP